MIYLSKPLIGEEEIRSVEAVLRSGNLAQNEVVGNFEKAFASYCGAKYAVAMNSGTAALHAGLKAVGVGPGEEVITSPFSFIASASAIAMLGAVPVFADIRETDLNIDPEKIVEKISARTRALVPVDLYGQVYDHEKIRKIARDNDLFVMEDACQAIGAEADGRWAGTFGNLGAFSLYATKNITSGEGGMLVTDNKEYAEKCRSFRHHGQAVDGTYDCVELGYNYRMTDINAAIGLAQLKKADHFNARRIANARLYTEGLREITGLVLPSVLPGRKHVFHQYTVRVGKDYHSSREELLKYLKDHGISGGIFYSSPLHLHTFFSKYGYKKGDCPVAEKMADEVLQLPVHPGLSEEEVKKVIEVINNFNE